MAFLRLVMISASLSSSGESMPVWTAKSCATKKSERLVAQVGFVLQKWASVQQKYEIKHKNAP